jgi:hypothetical protein
MPGVEFAPIGIGLVEKPGGIFAGSRLTALAVLALAVGASTADEQAKFAPSVKQIRTNKKFLNIKSEPRKKYKF